MSYGERDLCNFCINLNLLYKAACQYCFLFIQNISVLKTCLLTSALSSPLQTFAVPSQFQDTKLRDIILLLIPDIPHY